MLFVLTIAAIVIGGFVSAALLLPVWGLGVLSGVSVAGIAYGSHIASRHDEVKGSMGAFSVVLLILANVVLWAVWFFARF